MDGRMAKSLVAGVLLAGASWAAAEPPVDVFIGTAGLGHVSPAACAPFGLVQAEGFAPGAAVSRVTWNGRPVADWKLRHADLVAGGELVFEMVGGPTDKAPRPEVNLDSRSKTEV